MFYNVSLAILFLIRLWCGSHCNVLDHIRSRYGGEKVKQFWRCYNEEKKLVKSQLDVDFLKLCKAYNVVPKFVRFKLHRRALQSANFYTSWQAKLLTLELNYRKKTYERLKIYYTDTNDTLNRGLSIFDLILLNAFR